MTVHAPVTERPELHGVRRCFRDFGHAGAVLAGMLQGWRGSDTLVLGVPAGGALVGASVARALDLPFDVVVAAKVSLPGDAELGVGAVAFDGRVRLDRKGVEEARLSTAELLRAARAARAKVRERQRALRGARRLPSLVGRTVLLVDDGVATGGTARAVLQALRRAGAGRVVVAVPTGHDEAVAALSEEADAVYCANVRPGPPFAVAGAYSRWDVPTDPELRRLLPGHWEHFERGRAVGIRGVGRTREEAFEQVALGLTSLRCARPEAIRIRATQTLRCQGRDVPELLAAWLEGILDEGRRKGLVFGRYCVQLRGTTLEATASGERWDADRHGPLVEARRLLPGGFTLTLDQDRVWSAECLVEV